MPHYPQVPITRHAPQGECQPQQKTINTVQCQEVPQKRWGSKILWLADNAVLQMCQGADHGGEGGGGGAVPGGYFRATLWSGWQTISIFNIHECLFRLTLCCHWLNVRMEAGRSLINFFPKYICRKHIIRRPSFIKDFRNFHFSCHVILLYSTSWSFRPDKSKIWSPTPWLSKKMYLSLIPRINLNWLWHNS